LRCIVAWLSGRARPCAWCGRLELPGRAAGAHRAEARCAGIRSPALAAVQVATRYFAGGDEPVMITVLEEMWNPDAVMRVDVASATVDSQERLDEAAAPQLVLADALFHIVGRLIRTTGSTRLGAGRRHRPERDRQHAADGSLPGAARLGAACARRCGRAGRRDVSFRTGEWRAAGGAAAARLPLRCGGEQCRDRGCAARPLARSAGNRWEMTLAGSPICSPRASRRTACCCWTPKAGGVRLGRWLRQWRAETAVTACELKEPVRVSMPARSASPAIERGRRRAARGSSRPLPSAISRFASPGRCADPW
jgi:hypothetical protein